MTDFELGKQEGVNETLGLLSKGCLIKDDIRQKAVVAREFMVSHPAFSDNFDGRCLSWSLQRVCKRGICEHSSKHLSIHFDEPEAAKFMADFEEEYKEEREAMKAKPFMYSIYKTYEEVYGEPWVYDHVEFWWELTFLVFEGDVSRDSKEWMDTRKWGAYGFEMGGAPTFEQCLVDAADVTKKYLGDFDDYEDFQTEEEKENHKGKMPFYFEPCDVIHHNPLNGKDEKCSVMKHTEGYLDVHSGMINRRWLEWFAKTDYCKEKWGDDFDIRLKVD